MATLNIVLAITAIFASSILGAHHDGGRAFLAFCLMCLGIISLVGAFLLPTP